jgi:hypothetical protein
MTQRASKSRSQPLGAALAINEDHTIIILRLSSHLNIVFTQCVIYDRDADSQEHNKDEWDCNTTQQQRNSI